MEGPTLYELYATYIDKLFSRIDKATAGELREVTAATLLIEQAETGAPMGHYVIPAHVN